jgi:hypothetical protein
MRFDREIFIKKSLEVDRRWKNSNLWKFCSGKEQTGFDWNLFGTPGTIPEPFPILVFFDNFVRPTMASREPCSMRRRILTKVGLLERLFNRLSEFVYDMLMSCRSIAMYSEMSNPSLNNPILATILYGSLNFFHSNWKDFDRNRCNWVNFT